MKLDNFFTKSQVIKISATEKQPALKELISELQNQSIIENSSRYYAQIAHRESLENTGIGNALAIPHARTDSVDKFITILGIADTPIEYQSIDQKPVKYILLSIFPTSMSTKYLYLIGMIARIFNNRENNSFLEGIQLLLNCLNFLIKNVNHIINLYLMKRKKILSEIWSLQVSHHLIWI